MNNRQGANFPIPQGEATVVGPDSTVKAYGDNTLKDGLSDARYVHGGPNACGYGAFGDTWDSPPSSGDVTTATPRRKPDYGIG